MHRVPAPIVPSRGARLLTLTTQQRHLGLHETGLGDGRVDRGDTLGPQRSAPRAHYTLLPVGLSAVVSLAPPQSGPKEPASSEAPHRVAPATDREERQVLVLALEGTEYVNRAVTRPGGQEPAGPQGRRREAPGQGDDREDGGDGERLGGSLPASARGRNARKEAGSCSQGGDWRGVDARRYRPVCQPRIAALRGVGRLGAIGPSLWVVGYDACTGRLRSCSTDTASADLFISLGSGNHR